VTTGCVPICAPLVRMIDADLAFRLALDVRNGAHPDDRHLLRAMLQVRKRARRKLADGPFWRCQLRAHYAQSHPLMNDERGSLADDVRAILHQQQTRCRRPCSSVASASALTKERSAGGR